MVKFDNGIHFEKFKNLISNSYRNYCYDIKFEDNGGEAQLFDDIIDKYLFDNVENISMLCKSVGKLEAEIVDQKVEMEGRNIITGGKFNYKSPIVLQFYDVVLGQLNGKSFSTSDLFKHWIERWNLDNPTNTADKLYTRRRYLDENSMLMKIKVYRGNFTGAPNTRISDNVFSRSADIKKEQEKLFSNYKTFLRQNKNENINFDRWQEFWSEEDVKLWGGFEFMNAMNGVGGSGITLHGLINGYVFTFIKALTISEMFVDLSNDIKKNEFDESAGDYALKQLADAAGFDLLHEKPQMSLKHITGAVPEEEVGLNKNFNRNMFDSESYIKELQTYLTSRSLNVGLLEQLNTIKNIPSFGETKKEIDILIDKTQFESPNQKQTLKNILNIIMNGNINNDTVKEFGSLVDQYDNYISNEALENVKRILSDKIEKIESSFSAIIDKQTITEIRKIITALDNIIISDVKDPFTNEQRIEEVRKVMNILNELNLRYLRDPIIDPEILKQFFKETKFERGSIGWFLKSRNYFTSLFLPATAFVRILQSKDNLKSFYNIMMPNNGWDDFLNSTELIGSPESTYMRSTNTINAILQNNTLSLEEFMDFNSRVADVSSTDKLLEFDSKYIPGENFERLFNSYKIENNKKDSLTNSTGKSFNRNELTSPLREFILTRCYPTNVNIQPEVSNDKIGTESIPVIEVSFNFYNIERS